MESPTFNVWFNNSGGGDYQRVFTIGIFASAGNFQFERGGSDRVVVHINNSFVNSKFTNVSFQGSKFTNASFTGATFENVDFSNTELDGITFQSLIPALKSGTISLKGTNGIT